MSRERVPAGDSPYKFLAHYEETDSAIFFGRERETEVLLSDIISARIVVLFARTGTGKTSLINAGVRPRLEELDYTTFYIRVETDPEASLRRALEEAQDLPADVVSRSLAEYLRQVVTLLGKPVVVFFDQFEEFFIHLMKAENKEKVQRFISTIAALYRDWESGVHTVFSMREEYFVEMDAFRDEIPSIFHNESSLRLRPLDTEQARRAIELPARTQGVRFHPALTKQLLADLVDDENGIEPVRLQIVCDSLWSERTGDQITLESYDRLGGTRRILEQRLEDGIRSLSDVQLHLVEQLLPMLRTRKGTKNTLGVEDLVGKLGADPATLSRLIEQLQALRLLRKLTRHQAVYVEWESDYLAAQTDWLLRRVRATGRRRLLASAIARHGAGIPLDDDGSAALRWLASMAETGLQAMPLSQDELVRLSDDPALLELRSGEAALILLCALAYGAYMSRWFEEAERDGVSVWAVLRELVDSPDSYDEAAVNSVRLLGSLGTREATELLAVALAQPTLVDTALNVLGDMRTSTAVRILADAAQEEATSSRAVGVLRRMGMEEAVAALAAIVRRGGAPALRTGLALSVIASAPGGRPITRRARDALADALDEHAADLLVTALRLGLETRFWFDQARNHGIDVWEILRASIVEGKVPIEQSENAVRLLAELPDKEAEPLLRKATEQNRIARSATELLSDRHRPRTPAPGGLEPEPGRELRALKESTWISILQGVEMGRVTPILGAGAEPPEVPRPEQIARQWTSRYELPVPAADVEDLAVASQALSVMQDRMFVKLSLVEEIRRTRDGEGPGATGLDDQVSPYRVMADLPFSIYITTSYDDQLVRALQRQDKRPRRHYPLWNDLLEPTDRPPGEELDYQPTVEEPLVFHLFGILDEPDSVVLTEDEYLQFLIRAGRQRIIPVQVRKAMAMGSQWLIGHRPRSWAFRTLLTLLTAESIRYRRYSHVLTLDPADTLLEWEDRRPESVAQYLEQYFGEMLINLYWGGARSFAEELYRRWTARRPEVR